MLRVWSSSSFNIHLYLFSLGLFWILQGIKGRMLYKEKKCNKIHQRNIKSYCSCKDIKGLLFFFYYSCKIGPHCLMWSIKSFSWHLFFCCGIETAEKPLRTTCLGILTMQSTKRSKYKSQASISSAISAKLRSHT